MSLTDNLEKLLASGRDDPMLRFGLGSAYFAQKDFASAIVHLRACIEQDKEYSAAYKLLGKALFKEGELAEAEGAFEAGLPVAVAKGDKQAEKEIISFLRKIDRNRQSSGP